MKGKILIVSIIALFISVLAPQVGSIKQRYSEQLQIDRDRISIYTKDYSY